MINFYRIRAQQLDERLAVSIAPWGAAFAIILIAGLVCGLGGWYQNALPRWLALYGGIIAIGGVLVSLRPMIRLGGYENWRKYQRPSEVVTPGYEWLFDEPADREEVRKDDEAQQIVGPAMIGVGTFINAISGFLS